MTNLLASIIVVVATNVVEPGSGRPCPCCHQPEQASATNREVQVVVTETKTITYPLGKETITNVFQKILSATVEKQNRDIKPWTKTAQVTP